MRLFAYLPVLLLALAACHTSPVAIDGFDLDNWRHDKFGCHSKRIELLQGFEQKVKPRLLADGGLNEKQVVELLGRPDRVEIADRGLKFYTYFLETGPQCQPATTTAPARHIRLRFDALGSVNEVSLVNQKQL